MAKIRNSIIMVSGGGAVARLYVPTISISGLTLTITNSANNGAFVEAYDVYSGSTKIGTTTSTTYDLASSSGMTSGSNSITVKATAQGFQDSVASNAETVSIYTITNTLSNITTSNSASIVLANGSYSATLTPATDWTYGTTTVTMGGNDITSTAYDNGVITIASVTGDITITSTAYVPITNTLTGVTNSNSAVSVAYGSSYSGTITVSSGYTMEGATISITMGGVDVTSSVYSNGTITISSVTGAVVITISAVAVGPAPYVSFIGTSEFTLSKRRKTWSGTLEYSTNGTSWTEWDASPISSINNQVFLRGTGNTSLGNSYSNGLVITSNDAQLEISVKGNIENLIDYSTVSLGNHPTFGIDAFQYLFDGITYLKYANELELLSTTITANCYQGMFYGCSGLVLGPLELPATNGANNCYNSMFSGCSSLTTPPAIKLSSYAPQYACSNMFSGCSSLTSIPKIPAYGDNAAFRNMFNGCSNIKISSTQTAEYTNVYKTPNKYYSGSSNVVEGMFSNTGGTFTGTPSLNTNYYTSNTVVS